MGSHFSCCTNAHATDQEPAAPAPELPKSAVASDVDAEHEPSAPRTDTVPSIEINIDPNDPGIARGDRDNNSYGAPRQTTKNTDTKPGGQQKGSTAPSGGKAAATTTKTKK